MKMDPLKRHTFEQDISEQESKWGLIQTDHIYEITQGENASLKSMQQTLFQKISEILEEAKLGDGREQKG